MVPAVALVGACALVILAPAAASYAYSESRYANQVETVWNQKITSLDSNMQGGKIVAGGTVTQRYVGTYWSGWIWQASGWGTVVSGTHPSTYGVSKCWWTYNPQVSGTQVITCYRYV
jgi:hypothetical protein